MAFTARRTLRFACPFLLVACASQPVERRPPPTAIRRSQPTPMARVATPSAPALPPPGAYRGLQDQPEVGRYYQLARHAYDQGKKLEALGQMQNYVSQHPSGQFADEAHYLLGKQAFDQSHFDEALKHFESIMEMSPPSRLRGESIYYAALCQADQNQKKEALATLAKLDIREVNPTQRSKVFLLWGRVAADEGRWLESTLAYVKARREITDANQQKDLETLIEEQIDEHLAESELNFIAQEYPSDFPSLQVQMRLVSLKLAAGGRLEAQGLLQSILNSAPEGSKVKTKAQQLLSRLQSLGDAKVGRIGALLPLSGRSEPLGRAVADGLQLALHASGNSPIELVLADAGPTDDSASRAFERLVFEDKVMAIVGPLAGSQAEVVANKAAELGVPNIVLSPRPGLREKSAFIFRMSLTPERQVRALVAYATERLNAKNFAALFPEDNFGKEFATEYMQAVRDFGGQITALESYEPNQADFRVPIENMIGMGFPQFRRLETEDLRKSATERSGRPLTAKELDKVQAPPIVDFDVLFIPDTFKPLGQIVPALSYEGVSPQLMGPATWNNPKLLSRAGQYLDKAFFVDSFATERQSRVTKEFAEKFQLKRGTGPSPMAAAGYDVGLALRLAYGNSSAPQTRDDLRSRLENLGSFDGAQGVQSWDSRREVLAELQLFQVKKGAFHHQGGIALKPRSGER